MKIQDIDGKNPTLEEEITILESRCTRCDEFFKEEDKVMFVTTGKGKTLAWHAYMVHRPCYYNPTEEIRNGKRVRHSRNPVPQTILCHFCKKEFKSSNSSRRYCSRLCCLNDREAYYFEGLKYFNSQVIPN